MKRIVMSVCALLVGIGGANAQLVIGQTAGFSGPVAAGVKETAEGAKLYLDSVNARGGVHGQQIELLQMDDRFEAKTAAENAKTLAEKENVLALFLSRGTPVTQAMMPVLEKHNIALVAPSTGAMALHKPVHRQIFNVRATYQREAEKVVAHLASIGLSRIAVVHNDDSFGADGMIGAQKGLSAAGLSASLVDKVARTKPDFSAIAPKIAATGSQAVILIASGDGVVDGVKAIRAAGSKAQIVTLSNNASAGFVESLGADARGVIVTQVFPSERSNGYPMVKEARELAKARQLTTVSPAMLEGFAAAKVLVEGLRRAGPAPTREKLITALESIRKFDLGGMEISYASDDHTGLEFADLSIIGPQGKFTR